ncbi:sensor histidine kinase [Hydrogenophaga sp.]|uniref:sensor histidine kinase n=1 Tax=Hydrogenophaga sp. TaxID=1904254 RepID=UPI0027184E59|nr:ATP-binding protein [Hydrogenophaga sp.]MDO9436440.1 ATP-binding protein [Hydrogenophaga sp.]
MLSRFKLAEYFTVGSFAFMGLIATTLMYFQSRQSNFFESVQTEEIRLVQETQRAAIDRGEEMALRHLLSSQENAAVQLMRLLSSALWARDVGAFLAQAQSMETGRCHTLGNAAQKACQASQGETIRGLPQWSMLDTQVRATMRGTAIVKIQVHDLRGTTLYSTDITQIGNDASTRPGWADTARQGKVFSELAPRDKRLGPSPAEGPRELIVSYLPMLTPDTGRLVGVFEMHADVTASMRQIKAASQVYQNAANDNLQRATRQVHDTQEQIERSGRIQMVVVASLLALLYIVMLAIVRRSQEVVRRQGRESHAHQQRLVQIEKLATLGQMVASVTHQLKTPLAFSKSNVFAAIQSLDHMTGLVERSAYLFKKEAAGDPDATVPHNLNDVHLATAVGRIPHDMVTAQEMLGDVLIGMDQMSELVNHLHNFTRVDKTKTTLVKLNQTLATVMVIAKSVIPGKVRLVEAFEELPALACNASQLNQVFLNLIVNAAQAIRGAGTVTISTRRDRDHIVVCVVDTGNGIAKHVLPRIFDPYFSTKPSGEGTGLGLTIAKSIVADHGGQIVVDTQVGVGSRFKVYLPLRTGK